MSEALPEDGRRDAADGFASAPGLDGLRLPPTERDYYLTRRAKLAGHLPGQVSKGGKPVGLALSGGGIRSATLSLGVLTALSAKELIHRFDFLSTVSGGGYTGGFYGSLFVPPAIRGAPSGAWVSPLRTEDPLGTPGGRAGIRHLRENGRYLLDGAGDALRLAVIAIRAWLAVHVVIGVTLLALFLTIKTVQAWLVNAGFMARFASWQAERFPSFLWVGEWLRGFPIGDAMLLSWLWLLAGFSLALAVMAGWAFWLTRLSSVPESRAARLFSGGFVGTFLIAVACLSPALVLSDGCGATGAVPAICSVFAPAAKHLYYVTVTIGLLAGGAILFYAAAELRYGMAIGGSLAAEGRVRTALTACATFFLAAALVLALLAVIDTTTQTLYHLLLWDYRRGIANPLSGGALVAALTPLIRTIIEKVQTSGSAGPGVRRFGRAIALVLAFVLVLLVGMFWATLAEYVAWRGGPIGGGVMPIFEPLAVKWSPASVAVPAACFCALAVAIGLSPGFLNLSTFSAFYAARLRRAYLGASNPARTSGAGRKSIETEDDGDDILPHQYYNPLNGAPLHILNVTVNETKGRNGSALVQRDRKGLSMTVSPAGFLVGGRPV